MRTDFRDVAAPHRAHDRANPLLQRVGIHLPILNGSCLRSARSLAPATPTARLLVALSRPNAIAAIITNLHVEDESEPDFIFHQPIKALWPPYLPGRINMLIP